MYMGLWRMWMWVFCKLLFSIRRGFFGYLGLDSLLCCLFLSRLWIVDLSEWMESYIINMLGCCATVKAFPSLKIHYSYAQVLEGRHKKFPWLSQKLNKCNPIWFIVWTQLKVWRSPKFIHGLDQFKKNREGQQRRRKNTVHYREGRNFIAFLYCSVFLSKDLLKSIFYKVITKYSDTAVYFRKPISQEICLP
jgi:hypothetical protein